jgi:hypothetical protein
VFRVLVKKPEGKKPLWRPSRKWKNYIKMVLQEVECGHIKWIELAQERYKLRALVTAVMNFLIP